jgi:hypothetical protein
MVDSALSELRPYGVPNDCQGFVEWKPEGLKFPIVGYSDYHWREHNITIDLKTTEKLPIGCEGSSRSRQVSLYVTTNNADARICYTTPKKQATYQCREHRRAPQGAAPDGASLRSLLGAERRPGLLQVDHAA